MRQRLEHLQAVDQNPTDTAIVNDYFLKRLNRMIVDYFLRENYFDTADSFISETNLNDFVDIEVFKETNKILRRLQEYSCSEALNWCNTYKTKLQKSNSMLEFKLRRLEFIELLKSGASEGDNYKKGIEYARKNMSKFMEQPEVVMDLQKTMVLLAARPENQSAFEAFDEKTQSREW